LINIVSFGLFALDKWFARKNKWRIPESRLLMTCAIGGAVGALMAMYLTHHKTRKISFKWGVPAILLIQVALVVYSMRYLAG
jgi:uncharacterized membrane protein YsdA (DUF1294 family)